MSDSITCPRCGRTSYHPIDIEQGYCGACHDWTKDEEPMPISPDPFDGPEMADWIEHVRTGLIPKLQESALTISLVPSHSATDIKFAVELGLSIMMDKPIIAVIEPGTVVSEHMTRVADAIVELDISDPNMGARVAAAIQGLGIDLGSIDPEVNADEEDGDGGVQHPPDELGRRASDARGPAEEPSGDPGRADEGGQGTAEGERRDG